MAVSGRVVVENNFLSNTDSERLDKAVEKIKYGDKSLAAANELIKLENADVRSDALVSKFTKDPSQMNSTERAELAGYLRVYASEMEKEYGTAVSQELVKELLSGQDYIKRAPDSEAMAKAQTIMNTWGYHKSNASIGDAPLIFGSSIKGEDPTNSTIAAGAGSIFGGTVGKVATEQLKPVIKEGSAEIIGAVTGGTVSEITGKNVQDALNNAGDKNGKN